MDGKKSILHRRIGYMYPSKTKGYYGGVYLDTSGRITTKSKAVSLQNIYGLFRGGRFDIFIASGGDYANDYREKFGHKGANYGVINDMKKEISKGYSSKRSRVIKVNKFIYP